MKGYKWTPTFHGSLKKDKVVEAKPVSPDSNPCAEVALDFSEMFITAPKEKAVAQTATNKTTKKAAKTTKKKVAAPAIFQWTFESSQNVGGQKAVYSTLLRSNGDLTCNCPGWIFKRGSDRFCKHTKMVEEEGKKLFKDHKAGKPLPEMELVGTGNIAQTANSKKNDDLKYGRRIILD